MAPAASVYTPAAATPTYAAPTYASGPYAPNAGFFPQNQFWGGNAFGTNPVYAQPPYWGGPWGNMGNTTLGQLFGGVNIGQLIDLVGQGFAAIRLPVDKRDTSELVAVESEPVL